MSIKGIQASRSRVGFWLPAPRRRHEASFVCSVRFYCWLLLRGKTEMPGVRKAHATKCAKAYKTLEQTLESGILHEGGFRHPIWPPTPTIFGRRFSSIAVVSTKLCKAAAMKKVANRSRCLWHNIRFPTQATHMRPPIFEDYKANIEGG